MSEDKKLNEVIRVKKRPSNFVMMDKTFLEDDRLSYKAKGLLAYLLSKPDDWKVIVGNLVNSSKDGKAHENIGYEQFKQTYPGDIELIDEFVNVMLDVLLSEGGVIRINGEVKSRELIQSQIVKLEYADVEYVLMQFKQQKERIKKKSQYILSMLYQSRLERNAHYTNWVQSNE